MELSYLGKATIKENGYIQIAIEKTMKNLFLIILSALSLTAFAQQKNVAVYVTGEQTTISKVLGDELVKAFAKSGKYTAIERTKKFLEELGKEHAYQRSGAVEDTLIARLGIQFGVKYVCIAEMSDFFNEKYISSRLIDVETAEVVNLHSVHGVLNSPDACMQMASEIASNLSKGSFKEQEEDAKNKAAEEERLRAEQEAQERRAKDELKRKLEEDGYVDLGLPSGTWWKNQDEDGLFSFDMAIETFGDKMPTAKQCKELADFCTCKLVTPNKWDVRTWYYVITGRDGNSIQMKQGEYEGSGNRRGCFWSSTKDAGYNFGLQYCYYLYLSNGKDGLHISSARHSYKYPVRLVRCVK